VMQDRERRKCYKEDGTPKVKYLTEEGALHAIDRLLHDRERRLDRCVAEFISHYPCPVCGFWHIGSSVWRQRDKSSLPTGLKRRAKMARKTKSRKSR
jgi:hypothetical protein